VTKQAKRRPPRCKAHHAVWDCGSSDHAGVPDLLAAVQLQLHQRLSKEIADGDEDDQVRLRVEQGEEALVRRGLRRASTRALVKGAGADDGVERHHVDDHLVE
jgi:hypothetical protein